MSYWKAYAQARDISGDDLFDRHVAALETLQAIADALEVEVSHTVRAIAPTTGADILETIAELQKSVKDAQEDEDKADKERREAEKGLRKDLKEASRRCGAPLDQTDKIRRLENRINELSEERHAAVVERDELHAKLAATAALVESYSDALATARKFVGAAERAGVKTRHARQVKP